MAWRSWSGSPPVMMPSQGIHRPKPYKPFPTLPTNFSTKQETQRWNDSIPRKISRAISQILERGSEFDLPGWCFYDPFIRFLHTIGPKNCAFLKSLSFSGTALLHRCANREMCQKCTDDLVGSLRIYTQFIIALCPKVERITIFVHSDPIVANNPNMLQLP